MVTSLGDARPPFSDPEPEAVERERPEINSPEDVWCWMNTWGDLAKHDYEPRSGEWVGYRRAISDLLVVLSQAGIGASDEAWARWTGL